MISKMGKMNKKIQVNVLLNTVISFVIATTLSNSISLIVYHINSVVHSIMAYLFFPLFIILFVFSFFILTRKIVSDLVKLESGLQIISEGNLNYRVPVVRNDEIGRVAEKINVMTERLQEQLIKERAIEQSKMELITGISHDLRTPLTSIIGYIELLRSDSFQSKDEYMRFLQNTYNKTIHLKNMLDDLFEYTRLSSHEGRIEMQEIELSKLLSQLLFEFEPLAQESDMEVTMNLVGPPVNALVDSEKIARAIDNLLMNALKYSIKPGTIRIKLQSDQSFATITIENEGPPLTSEQEQRLFERFYKADLARSTEGIQVGAGLGLSIARNIAELHGGSLMLEHQNGHYEFRLAIPMKRSATI